MIKSRLLALSRRRSTPFTRSLFRGKAGATALVVLAATTALGCLLLGAARLRAAVPVPAQQAPTAASDARLALTMTVGTDAGACATERSVTVPAGRSVYVCYTAQNTGNVTFTNHLISDRSLDPVYAAFARPMPPGAVLTYTTPSGSGRLYAADTVVTDAWTADSGADGDLAQAEDSVEVNVVNPDVQITTTVGALDGGCASTTAYKARRSTGAQFCVRIRNTGDTPLAALQVTVASQPANAINVTGTITSFPLAPGAVLDIFDTSDFGSQLAGSLVISGAAVPVTATATVRAATIDGFPFTPPNSTAVMSIGLADVALTPSINTAAECAASTSISVLVNQPFHFCLRVKNTGTVTLTDHTIRSVTPPISVTFPYTLEPQASMAVTNVFLRSIAQPEVMGPRVYTSVTTVSTSFVYTATNSAGFTITKSSGTVSAGVTAPTATPTLTWTPTDAPPTNTPWPTLSPTPTWTPWPTSTPTWTPVTPSATPTRDWNASLIATPTPNPAQLAAAAPDFNATNVAVQMTADAAAGVAATSPLDTPYYEQSPLDPNATPATLSVALPLGTPTPRALFFMPTPTLTITPTADVAARPLAPPGAPPAASSTTGLFLADFFDALAAAAGLMWFAAGTVIFFGAAGVMAVLIWRDAARNRARRRARAYDLEPELPLTSSIEPGAPPSATPPAGVPQPPAPPRARPPAQDDTHWPASLP